MGPVGQRLLSGGRLCSLLRGHGGSRGGQPVLRLQLRECSRGGRRGACAGVGTHQGPRQQWQGLAHAGCPLQLG